jgi:hypothetical protein
MVDTNYLLSETDEELYRFEIRDGFQKPNSKIAKLVAIEESNSIEYIINFKEIEDNDAESRHMYVGLYNSQTYEEPDFCCEPIQLILDIHFGYWEPKREIEVW